MKQATIVWFPEDKCTTFQVAKTHARMIKFHQKHFIESIPFEDTNYTISRIFQEKSLSKLETVHHLCELERTQIRESLALAVLKMPYSGYLLSGNRTNFLDYEGNILCFYSCTKKVSPLYVFEDKRCYKRIPILFGFP